MKTLLACFLVLAACGDSSTSSPDAALTGAQACANVGIALCHQVFACYSASEIADLQYPPTEAGCVTEENANCAQLMPGYCKSSAQTSIANAEACTAAVQADTCAQFKGTAADACSQSLCM